MRLHRSTFTALAWMLMVAASAQRVPADSLIYECQRTSIHLAVKMDPWGTGLRLDPDLLHLGSCPLSHVNDARGFFHFQYSLKECGFARLTSGKMVEYSAFLVYRPVSSHSSQYLSPFNERINCTDYEAERLIPQPITGSLSASSGLMFRGTFMNEDFTAPSASSIFLLGSQIHIEFMVQRFFHQPLRLFVDECIAAATPELARSPRNYSVIANHGCVVDGRVSNSYFLPRPAPDVLQLVLQAFEFVGINTDIYLHCRVLIWDPEILTDPTRKACSFSRDINWWKVLDGSSSSVCSCCDLAC